jgi:ABC-2 type transport system permease protein
MLFRVGLFRDPVALVAIMVTWTAAACSFGMFIATFSKSAKQADGLATILILTMAALGGCWFPLQMMTLPLLMDIATKSMMTYWAMEGMQGMLWNNLSVMDGKIQFALGIQWLWTIVLSGLSIYFFRKNYCSG